jgi:hypothetical protein
MATTAPNTGGGGQGRGISGEAVRVGLQSGGPHEPSQPPYSSQAHDRRGDVKGVQRHDHTAAASRPLAGTESWGPKEGFRKAKHRGGRGDSGQAGLRATGGFQADEDVLIRLEE